MFSVATNRFKVYLRYSIISMNKSSAIPFKRYSSNTEVHPAKKVVDDDYLLMHPVYTNEYVDSVKPKHLPPIKWHQKVGFYAIGSVRFLFDKATGYPHSMSEAKWLQRMIFLETVAGCPGTEF
eukprot:NODE_304_length_11385_cov_0.300018.p7 type:complete len:123 gc:universal NODE_304_length_11385_cov_0.300018:5256-5624(+)